MMEFDLGRMLLWMFVMTFFIVGMMEAFRSRTNINPQNARWIAIAIAAAMTNILSGAFSKVIV